MNHMEKDLQNGVRICLTGTVITLYNALAQPVRRWVYGDIVAARVAFMRITD